MTERKGPISYFLLGLRLILTYGVVIAVLALLASILLGGCQAYDSLPRQDEATVLVWNITYRDLTDDPPRVQWITQGDLDCDQDRDGRFHGFYRWRWWGDVGRSDRCVGGVTWPDWSTCQVALPDGETFSETAFAHELYHMYLNDTTGDADPGHTDPGFGIAFGHLYGIVDAANKTLKDNGL